MISPSLSGAFLNSNASEGLSAIAAAAAVVPISGSSTAKILAPSFPTTMGHLSANISPEIKHAIKLL